MRLPDESTITQRLFLKALYKSDFIQPPVQTLTNVLRDYTVSHIVREPEEPKDRRCLPTGLWLNPIFFIYSLS